MPELHLPNEFGKRNNNKPVGIKLVLGTVFLDENNKEKYSLNSNRICVSDSNIHDSLNNSGRLNLTVHPKTVLKDYYENQNKMLLKY